MNIAQVCAATLLFHEVYYYANDGSDAYSVDFMPALGLSLGSKTKPFVHFLTAISSVWVLISPNILSIIALSTVGAIYCAGHRWRLSNHLMLVLGLLAICVGELATSPLSQTAQQKTIGYLLALVYFFGFFHKLNSGFFAKDVSCANAYMQSFFFQKSTFQPAGWLLALLPWFIVVYEFFLFVGVCVTSSPAGVMVAALPLHFLFGITGNAHFSVMIYALAIVMIGSVPDLTPGAMATIAVFAGMSLVLVDRSRFRQRSAASLAVAFFGMATGWCLAVLWASLDNLPKFGSPHDAIQNDVPSYVYFVLATIALNCCTPYFGKTEFSLAMFSNIRPDLDNHFIIRQLSSSKFLREEYLEIINIVCDRGIRNSSVATMRLAIISLDEYDRWYFRKLYVNECLRLAKKLGFALSIHARPVGGGDAVWLTQDSLSHSQSVLHRLCCNPPYVSKDHTSSYMG
ncbi:HTTM domain-containing protein [Acidovorax sp. DW039]|uniref:hypothetical protein n=1 Tax=Acidovorax sp. DW039 TaxID=3095606 RepID=UPI00308710E6|nr:HTTM domain-containing protein [Acidovorax sp. DW039]